MITASGLNALRDFLRSSVGYLMYKVGDTDYRAEISDAVILPDLRIEISAEIGINEAGVIRQVDLYSASGALWASKQENLAIAVANGYLYKFHFTITEIQEG